MGGVDDPARRGVMGVGSITLMGVVTCTSIMTGTARSHGRGERGGGERGRGRVREGASEERGERERERAREGASDERVE